MLFQNGFGEVLRLYCTKEGHQSKPEEDMSDPPKKFMILRDRSSVQNVKEVQQLIDKVAVHNKSLSRASDMCEKLFKSLKVVAGWQ